MLDFELCYFDSSLLSTITTESIEHSFQTNQTNKPKYRSEKQDVILYYLYVFSSYNMIVDSHTTNMCLNREPIADQSQCRL